MCMDTLQRGRRKPPRKGNQMSMNIKINEDFYVERYDFFCVELKGMTIINVEELDIGLAVKFKEPIEGAEDWDNEVHFYEEGHEKDLKKIKRIIKEGKSNG